MRTAYAVIAGAVIALTMGINCWGATRANLTLMGYVPEKLSVSIDNAQITVSEEDSTLNCGKIVLTSNRASKEDIQINSKVGQTYYLNSESQPNASGAQAFHMSIGHSNQPVLSDTITIQFSDT